MKNNCWTSVLLTSAIFEKVGNVSMPKTRDMTVVNPKYWDVCTMICIKIIIQICMHQCSIALSKEITNLSIHSQVRGAETTEGGVFNQSIHLLQKNLKRNRKMTRISADSSEIIAKERERSRGGELRSHIMFEWSKNYSCSSQSHRLSMPYLNSNVNIFLRNIFKLSTW